MAKRMVEKFGKYWSVIHGVVEVSAVLDPRYKINVLEFYFSQLFPSGYKEEVDRVRALCYKLLKEYQSPSSMVEGESSSGYATIYDDEESGDSRLTRENITVAVLLNYGLCCCVDSVVELCSLLLCC
ncbi:hypothetical protein Vadar_025985 [Vaccinium darrowii]|uniref:Uncharacterized protein n=1 Tax=Vaccinium darrowii TaxID=229202 RepID=A0ACB7ZGG2_9ERIC|nr:hypothetical protein Vadar_025985 [Vaccinium darrowii]